MRLVSLASLAVLCSTVLADGYQRQPGIDVLNYKFELTLIDETDWIEGVATIDVKFVQSGVREFWFDLKGQDGAKGMTVNAMTSPTRAVSFSHSGDRLHIAFYEAPAVDEVLQIVVRYGGVPTGGLWIGKNMHRERGFFSLNWPNRAREWLPMVDHPYDKATHEFVVTAPAHYQVVSNGLLQGTVENPDGTRTTHWKQSVPVASWLTALAVSRFAVRNFVSYEAVQLSTWVFPQDREMAAATFEIPAERAIRFFSESIGEYPYEKLANVQAAGFGGGTELASAIFYGQNVVTGRPATGLVAHEVAHQWWGNSVTESDWNDVWLSEGFATYFTLLYTEHYEGRQAFVAGLRRARDRVYAMEEAYPDRPVVHADLQDMKLVTSGVQYQKGAWILHMLRERIGTDVFWEGIREYYKTYRDKNASTADFRRVMEEVSGEDLERFFDQWLTRSVSPAIEVLWRYDAAKKSVAFDLSQTQDGGLYRLPLEILVEDTEGRKTTVTFEMDSKSESITLGLSSAPASVVIDPDTKTLLRWKVEERG